MPIDICIAGATGWAGSALARAVAQCDDLRLVAGVSRKHAGQTLGAVLGIPGLDAPLFATASEALTRRCEVFVEYTAPETAGANVLAALERGAHAVVGTSGLTDSDYAELDAAARKAQRGVLACGNFALGMVLMQKFAELAARYMPHWEIVDYAHDGKRDAPSGTARELAARLGRVGKPALKVPIDATVGAKEARGAQLMGSQVHSVRLPGIVIGAEAVFGMPEQTLSMRWNAGSSAAPYVDGALIAIRKVSSLIGVHRGLDAVLEL